ncbi:YqcI/YcgG family protein [Halalkalibacter urbisdiaboli]|uniref:YqcI/YcgG family protein n=1 Tax=Halalkalibacter urbisdiaboli TaxID=1960589 RepID=UPI000B42F521|nr:YqcI/YcgG family protein [Halalkalibacter urbisdiaboli]
MELLTFDFDHMTNSERNTLEEFSNKMTSSESPFPCIPATKGFSLGHFRYGFINDPREESSVRAFATLLSEYTKHSRTFGKFTSLIVFFETPALLKDYKDSQYERLFWDFLTKVSETDTSMWPEHIPTDPHQPLWEFCFQGEQYFIYCATPAHKKRKSRQFSSFLFAITPRWVLEQFHQSTHVASKIQSEIRKRLARYDIIASHPDLNRYGNTDNYEWKQYFLRDDQTTLSKCPFHRRK